MFLKVTYNILLRKFVVYIQCMIFLSSDLYADWVAQELKANLLVETWNHGAAGTKMHSECEKPYK